jgi:hypothetical protein
MSDEKTLKELQEELERLKKENLEREIAKEKQIILEAEAQKKQEEELKVREEIRAEEHSKILEEMATKEDVSEEKPETLERMEKAEQFKHNMAKKYGLTGKNYEDRIRDLVDKGLKW